MPSLPILDPIHRTLPALPRAIELGRTQQSTAAPPVANVTTREGHSASTPTDVRPLAVLRKSAHSVTAAERMAIALLLDAVSY